MFARKSNPDALNNGILVDFNIFEMSLFSCLPESEINMVKLKLELAIYQAKQGYVDPGSFVIAVNAAMLELETWVEEHQECCGLFRSSCGTCLDFEESKLFLESKGFVGQEVESYTDLEIPVSFRNSEHVVVHHDYSVVLKGAEIDVKGDLTQWSIDESKYFTPQKAEMRFLDGGMCDLDMATVEEDEIHAFTKIYAYLLAPGENDKGKNAVLFTKVKQGKGEGSGRRIHLLEIEGSGFSMESVKSYLITYLDICGCSPEIEIVSSVNYPNYQRGNPLVFFGANATVVSQIAKQDFCDVIHPSLYDKENGFPEWIRREKHPGISNPEFTEGITNMSFVSEASVPDMFHSLKTQNLDEAAAFLTLHSFGHMVNINHHIEYINGIKIELPFTDGFGFMSSGKGMNELMWSHMEETKIPKQPGDSQYHTRTKDTLMVFNSIEELVVGISKTKKNFKDRKIHFTYDGFNPT